MKIKSWQRWALAILIFLASAVYQRMTGPTHPVRGEIQLGGETISYKLPRTHGGPTDCPIVLTVPDRETSGTLVYKRFKTADPWSPLPLERHGDSLIAHLPHQPAAGKLLYQLTLKSGAQSTPVPADSPVVIRFKGGVPKPVLYFHVLFMSLAMIFSNRAGLEAFSRTGRPRQLVWWTMWTMLLGGLILGPIVQKFAFGAFWTGWPFGHDLTDNKTVLAFIFWLIPLFRGRRGGSARGWVLTAAIVTLGIYIIPHSVLGSELDYSKM